MNKIRRFVRFSAGGRWAHSLNTGLLCGPKGPHISVSEFLDTGGSGNLGFLFGFCFFLFPRHIAVVVIVPEQLLAFVGDVRGESRNPIQDGEDREIFL